MYIVIYMSCLISIFAVLHSKVHFDCINNILNEPVHDKPCKKSVLFKMHGVDF